MIKRATLALWLMTLSLGSATAADLAECAAIKDEAVRLFCYDRAAGRSSAASPAEVAPAPLDTKPAPTGEAPSPEPKPATVKAPERIESRIVGRFSGWAQGTRFQLENGQTWEVMTIARFQAGPQEAPKVVIARDFLGQYQMSVDGVTPRVVVRPVEPTASK
jgi:hypothetical protein